MRGIALVALAYLIISASDAAVKWALPEVGTAMAMIWRGVIGAACVALMARGRGLFPRDRRLLAARSLLHTGVSAAWYWAWARGVPLADTYAVAAAAPLLMTVLAIPMLAERVGWRRWSATLVGFGGVLVMLQPSGDLWRVETPVLLAAVAAMAVTRIWTRVLARTDTPAAIAFWLMIAHVPAGLALLPVLPPPSGAWVPSLGATLALASFGAVNALAHLLFGRAFALAPVSVLAPFEYSPLLWGGVLGFLIWAEVPSWTTLGGAAIVVAAGLYTVHRERVRRSQERRAAAAAGRGARAAAP
ncbi:DMT family transporter [Caldovatus sp. SYSU G05006]|uniref:DMT family transporter n=1 Tax=Caldovatus aquaticus TaxID=2865671 RepID=A0ABS7F343_9PROT|nr:DMT family transporter [Caldovatus aquaticus]